MRKHHRLLLAAATTAAIAATGAVTGVTAASAAQATPRAASGTEYVQIMSTATTPGPLGPASAIARGAFTAAGEAYLGDARLGKIVFAGGTIVLSHRPGQGTGQFNPRTCLAIISQPGTYQIVRGTGRYAGISGHGTYQLSLEFVAARAHGKCSTGQAPVAQQELLRLSGPVWL